MQTPDTPFFLPPPLLLNKQTMRKFSTNISSASACVLDYGLQNLRKGPDGRGDEINSQLVLVCGTIRYLVGQFKVDKNNSATYYQYIELRSQILL